MCRAGRDMPQKPVRQSIDWLKINECHIFQIFISKKKTKKLWMPHIFFLLVHNYTLLCVGLSHKIPIKYIVCGCNTTKMWTRSRGLNTFSRHCMQSSSSSVCLCSILKNNTNIRCMYTCSVPLWLQIWIVVACHCSFTVAADKACADYMKWREMRGKICRSPVLFSFSSNAQSNTQSFWLDNIISSILAHLFPQSRKQQIRTSSQEDKIIQ